MAVSLCRLGVLAPDGLEKVEMLFQRQRHVLICGEEGVIEDRALQSTDRIAQLLDDDVVRRQQDGLVEGDVGLVEARQIAVPPI